MEKRLWRLSYRFGGKQKTLALGAYPILGLAAARKARDTAKEQLARGVDPGEHRKQEKQRLKLAEADSFEAIAREWHANKKDALTERYAGQVMDRLEADVFPEIGVREIGKIEPPDLLAMLRKVEARGTLEMAKRVKEHCGQIFRYAIVTGRAVRDPSADLRGALKRSPRVKHHRAIPRDELPGLRRAIEAYDGEQATRLVLKLATLTLLRTTELRAGQWREIDGLDGDAPLWRVPDERMKMKGRGGHLVPLSKQAVEVLRELREITGRAASCSRHRRAKAACRTTRCCSRYIGWAFIHAPTTHGFRTIASIILNEAGFNSDAIERQLAHDQVNKVRAAYNAAEYLPERRRMLQWYADFLDAARAGGASAEVGVFAGVVQT